jgi:hypothetical protein
VGVLDGTLVKIHAPMAKESENVLAYFSGHYKCDGLNVLSRQWQIISAGFFFADLLLHAAAPILVHQSNTDVLKCTNRYNR